MMGPIFDGPRVRAIAIDADRPTTALITFSSPYQAVFRAMVFVFDVFI
jgi:hypothetical protein